MPLNLFGNKETHKINYDGNKALFENAQDEYPEYSKVLLTLLAKPGTIYEVRKDKYEIQPLKRSTDRLIYEFVMPKRDVKIQVTETSKKKKELLLFEYYTRITGTPIPRPYYQIQVCQMADGLLKIKETVEGGSNDQVINTYVISGEMKQEIRNLITKYDLEGWNSLENAECIDGEAESFRYLEDNTYITVSVNHMPEDGQRILGTIANTLRKHMK
ncbi:MAG: hypothetical protein IKE77_01990 [Erysipelotrichaceae bacterium]|nr:hypothetical protein [Erysipelotrichaceae bacterium]